MLWLHALGASLGLAGLALVSGVRTFAADYPPRLRAALAKARPADHAICRFARDFDYRAVDTWLIRATFEEVRSACVIPRTPPVPVRAADRVRQDLGLDGDEVDEIGAKVAARAGYSFAAYRSNPFHGKVETVGDIVSFLLHQPCTH